MCYVHTKYRRLNEGLKYRAKPVDEVQLRTDLDETANTRSRCWKDAQAIIQPAAARFHSKAKSG
jgi:hypothetical protein